MRTDGEKETRRPGEGEAGDFNSGFGEQGRVEIDVAALGDSHHEGVALPGALEVVDDLIILEGVQGIQLETDGRRRVLVTDAG